jgi:enoyl-CoA hydratase
VSNLETDYPVAGVLRITLNRPDSLNAFTWAMYQELIDLFEETSFRPDVRAIILTGAGKAFCAGHDLRDGGSAAWVAPEQGKAQATFAILNKLGRIAPLMSLTRRPLQTSHRQIHHRERLYRRPDARGLLWHGPGRSSPQ